MKKTQLLLLTLFFSVYVKAQLISDTAITGNMNRMFLKTKELAKNRSKELFGVFDKPLTADEKQALTFLFAYMPLSDLADYNGQFFLDNAKMALKAKSEMTWGKTIPEYVFLHFVLPLRVNNENLDSFRIVMYDELKKRVQGLPMKEAAMEVNHWCHEKVTYKAADERTSSPLSTVRYSLGRCGEESTFTVSALRMVGIPARQVYTPRWAHMDDNHAWVEIWIDGKWYFIGACEPDVELNMGWFANPAARAMLVHTRAYGKYYGDEPAILNEKRYSELNLIGNYAPTKYFTVKVVDSVGKPVSKAKVEYQVMNYSEFYALTKNYTDTFGYTGFRTGLGDLFVWADKNDAFGYKKITVDNTDTVTILIKKNNAASAPLEFELVPPVERSVAIAPQEGVTENNKRLHYEDSLRTVYWNTFKDTAWVVQFAGENNIDKDTALAVIIKSFGNWKEITSFIKTTPAAMRTWAMRMLTVITEKDLRDTKASILADHLKYAFKYDKGLAAADPVLFSQYVMTGRIANEMMIGWRSFLQQKFDTAFARKAKSDISVITKWITDNITVDNISNMHSRAPLTPEGVYNLKVADEKSRNIFFVALCRSLNIPARLNPETLDPQYRENGEWKFETPIVAKTENNKKGYFHIVNTTPSIEPKYYYNFTVAKFKDGVYRSLQYDENKLLKDFPDKPETEPGKYLLITGNRMNDGTLLTYVDFFSVYEGKTTDVNMKICEKATDGKPWGTLDTTGVLLNGYSDNKNYKLSDLVKQNGVVIVFIDPGKEPSKHVMVDIAAVKEQFEKWGGSIVFVVPGKSKSASFRPEMFPGLPKQSIFIADSKSDDFFFRILKFQGCPLENKYPMIIYANKQCKLYYYSEGYRIGAGEQLLKEIMKEKNR